MSKKVKHQARTTTTPVAAPQSSPASTTMGSRSFEREFNPDYTPVIKDLRRIGTLAGTFFAILIVLTFFLR